MKKKETEGHNNKEVTGAADEEEETDGTERNRWWPARRQELVSIGPPTVRKYTTGVRCSYVRVVQGIVVVSLWIE